MKTVIFDFDGTLADTFPFAKEIVGKYSSKYAKEALSEEEVLLLKGMSAREIVSRYNISEVNQIRMLLDAHKEIANYLPKIEMDRDLKRVLNNLEHRGYGIIIISSNSKANIRCFLHNNSFSPDWPIYSSLLLFGKHRKILHAIRRHNLEPSEVVYVGDEIRDVEAAERAGVKIVSVSWGYNTPESFQKRGLAFVSTPKDLQTAIAKLFKS